MQVLRVLGLMVSVVAVQSQDCGSTGASLVTSCGGASGFESCECPWKTSFTGSCMVSQNGVCSCFQPQNAGTGTCESLPTPAPSPAPTVALPTPVPSPAPLPTAQGSIPASCQDRSEDTCRCTEPSLCSWCVQNGVGRCVALDGTTNQGMCSSSGPCIGTDADRYLVFGCSLDDCRSCGSNCRSCFEKYCRDFVLMDDAIRYPLASYSCSNNPFKIEYECLATTPAPTPVVSAAVSNAGVMLSTAVTCACISMI